MKPAVFPFLVSLIIAAPSWAVDWNVNPAGTGDFPTIQAAFDGAAPGDRIVLAPGTYQDSNTRLIAAFDIPHLNTTTAVAHMSPGVSITSSGGPEVTFIDGESTHRGLVGADLGSVEVSGISLINARTPGNGGGTELWGGALLAYRSSMTIQGNHFFDNVSIGGGAVFLAMCPSATLEFNKFHDNSCDDLGGAVELYLVGGATVSNNTFVRNYARRRGGAILFNTSPGAVNNNIFTDNVVTGDGGAVAGGNGSLVTGSCNLFWNNSAPVNPNVAGDVSFSIGTAGNQEADPAFCSPADSNFFLQSNSPAAPTDPSGCGLRGACPVGCGPVSVQAESWGSVKSRYF